PKRDGLTGELRGMDGTPRGREPVPGLDRAAPRGAGSGTGCQGRERGGPPGRRFKGAIPEPALKRGPRPASPFSNWQPFSWFQGAAQRHEDYFSPRRCQNFGEYDTVLCT